MSKRRQYPIRLPRYAAGIHLQETHNVGCWWAKRWQLRLETMGLRGRLGRARNYAINGQVLAFERAANSIQARVQGVRPDPYNVSIAFRTPQAAVHKRILAALKREPMLLARLLVDDLPLEVEEIFRANKVDLLPGGEIAPHRYDVTTACSCPDYANPCKHVLAAMIVLGEEIARHPLLLLNLRGFTEKEFYDDEK